MNTIAARNVPNGYSSELAKTTIHLCINDKMMKDIERIIDQYRKIYIMYIRLLWNTVRYNSMSKLLQPIKFLKRYLRRKNKFVSQYGEVTRVMVDRVLYYVYKVFNIYYQDIWSKSLNWDDFDRYQNHILSYIDELIHNMDIDIPAFSLTDDYIVINKKDIDPKAVREGYLHIPKYGKMIIDEEDLNNIPKSVYIQGIVVLNSTQLNSNHKRKRKGVIYLPCDVYYNEPAMQSYNVTLSKHLQYYDALGLIDDITFYAKDEKIYCTVCYYKTIKDKKSDRYTICDLHTLVPVLNQHDLIIIRKYADERFNAKNEYDYNIGINSDGTISIRLYKLK